MKGKAVSSIVVTIVTILFIVGSSLPCLSQPPGEGETGGPGSPPFEGDEHPPPLKKREEIRKRIELIRMWKLTEELDLTEETGAKLFPILHKYDEKRMELQKEHHTIMKGLKEALENVATSDEEIEAAMENMEKNALAEYDLVRQQREELKGVLSPRQQAKFILFQRQFHRELRKIIAEARERRGKPRDKEGKARNRRGDRLKKD